MSSLWWEGAISASSQVLAAGGHVPMSAQGESVVFSNLLPPPAATVLTHKPTGYWAGGFIFLLLLFFFPSKTM